MSINRQLIRKSILAATFVLFEYRIFHLFFSPVLIVLAASQGVVNGSLLIYALLFLASLYFGRAWCGWLCPASAVNEACSKVVRKKPRRGKAVRIKYVVFALWASLICFMAIRAGGFHRINPFWGMELRSMLQDVLLLVGVVAILVPTSFILGKFGHCRYLCWLAPIMIIGTRLKQAAMWPSLHLEATREACLGCETCDVHCPMSLPVGAMAQQGSLENVECILCGNCVDHCPAGAIRYSWGVPK